MFRTIIKIVRNALASAFKAMKRVAIFAASTVAGTFDALFSHPTELPEPEIFMPTEEWVEETEQLHVQHEIGEAEGRLAGNPNSTLYRYVCTPRDKRDALDISAATPDAAAWARRLSDAEAILVRKSGCEAMLRHINGKKPISGVGPVRRQAPLLDFTQRPNGEFDHAPVPELPSAYRMAM